MSRPRPNILWVFADQMRGSAMSCACSLNGPEQNVHTPHLDAMAARGVRFSQAYSTFPVCVPFRFSLFTGQYAHTRLVPSIHYRLSPAERTVAHDFNEAGYHTSYFGKWHLYAAPMGPTRGGPFVPPSHRGGFREWHGFENTNAHFEPVACHGGDREPTRYEGFTTDVYFELLCEWLEQRHDRPFFTVLSVVPPHPPYRAKPEDLERQSARRLVHRPNVPGCGDERPADPRRLFGYDNERFMRELDANARNYYAMVENLDDNMGRLFRTLERTGLAEDTVVVFFADHGEMLGSHFLWQKSVPYEESIHIPHLVCGPGVAEGEVCGLPTCTEDFYPTALGLAGIEARQDLPGLDLAPCLRDPEHRPDRPFVMCQQVNELRQTLFGIMRLPWRALRSERYLFAALSHQPWLLYDMREDPWQQCNLVNDPDARGLVEHWCRELDRHLLNVGDDFGFDAERALTRPPAEPIWDIPVLVPEADR